VAAYIVLMIFGSGRARDAAGRHMEAVENRVPERVMAGPVPLNPLSRELIFDMGEHYRFGRLAWRPGTEITLDADSLPTNAGHPAAVASRADDEARRFLYWSRFPYFVIDQGPDATEVRLGDARFSRRAGGWSSVTVRVPGDDRQPAPD
jgi:hypothetical protein